ASGQCGWHAYATGNAGLRVVLRSYSGGPDNQKGCSRIAEMRQAHTCRSAGVADWMKSNRQHQRFYKYELVSSQPQDNCESRLLSRLTKLTGFSSCSPRLSTD